MKTTFLFLSLLAICSLSFGQTTWNSPTTNTIYTYPPNNLTKVGIGTQNPFANLHIFSDVYAGAANPSLVFQGKFNTSGYPNYGGWKIQTVLEPWQPSLIFSTYAINSSSANPTTWNDVFTIKYGGIKVNGTLASTGDATIGGTLTTTGNTTFNGKVGIGTSTPIHSLQINANNFVNSVGATSVIKTSNATITNDFTTTGVNYPKPLGLGVMTGNGYNADIPLTQQGWYSGYGSYVGGWFDVNAGSETSTNITGVVSVPRGTGSGNAFGFYSNLTNVGSGFTKYGIYSEGETSNYFSGNVGIGTTNTNGDILAVKSTDHTGIHLNYTTTGNWGYAMPINVTRDPSKDCSTVAFAIIDNGHETFRILSNGVIGAKKIYAESIEVRTDALSINWFDNVFHNDYKLRPLTQVEDFVKKNSHLPDIPSEKEVKEKGINIAQMDGLLLKKIEELTLYVIQQQKEIELLKAQVNVKK